MTGDETKDESGYAISERVHETYDQHGQHSMALAAACRVAVAEELRRLADERMASFETYRACCSIPISHCRLCSTREHAACRAALDLRTRADALDQEGATR